MAKTLSAGIIPVFLKDHKISYLLLRAYTYWDFPKGMVEPGEDPLDGALRELKEETTIGEAHFNWGKDFLETPPYARGKVARYYIAEVKTQTVDLPVNPTINRPEHQEFRWVSYEEAKTLVSERLKPILEWVHSVVEKGCRSP